MTTNCRRTALILVSLLPLTALAQERDQPAGARESEDQMIAEAIWSMFDFEKNELLVTKAAFEDAAKAYPESARVAYWQGRMGTYAADRSRMIHHISETLKEFAEAPLDDAGLSDPDLAQKMRSIRRYAKQMRERLQRRAKDESNTEDKGDDEASLLDDYETSLLDAATRDPSLIAAWAKLAESPDEEIAFAAIEAWAEQEPDNAMPYYTKAVLRSQKTNHRKNKPIDVAVIEALENGNTRPGCRVPEEPWPVEFQLNFPESLPEEAAELAGIPVTPHILRSVVENVFFQIHAVEAGTGANLISLRNLGGLILQYSHRLSPQEDERYLRAFVGVGLHLINSNRSILGGTAASVDRTINRLENIAIEQGDFEHANELRNILKHVWTVRRRVSDDFQSPEFGEDPARNDREATKIMTANRKAVSVPLIQFASTTEPYLVISDSNAAGDDDWVMMNLFSSEDRRVMVRSADQRLPDPIAGADVLSNLGYLELDQAIDRVRNSNLENHQRRGIFLVSDSPYLDGEIASECFTKGYVGQRDSCIVAFTERESLESFREYYPYVNMRVAQILEPSGNVLEKQREAVSAEADLIVAPLESLLSSDGEILPLVKSSDQRFIVTGADLVTLVEAAKKIPSVAGVVASELPMR